MVDPPEPRDPTWPRYTKRPFPAYRYLPGQTPHPVRDPRGHSFGQAPATLSHFSADRWQDSGDYLYGIDLFNFAYWWECHEALEGVWVAAGRRSDTGSFVRGLIQISAAHLKWHLGEEGAARSLAERGLSGIESRPGLYLGIDVDAFTARVRAALAGSGERPVLIRLHLEPS